MDIAAIESAVSSLERSAESLDAWLRVWTAVVVIGVAVEIFVVLKEHRVAYRAWLRASIRSPEKPTIGMLLIHLAGPALVTVGVAGELYVSVASSHINVELRNKNRELVGLIRQKASDAESSAADASKETARLKVLASWRSLTDGQQNTIFMACRPFSGMSLSLRIRSQTFDAEGSTLAYQIGRVLDKCGISWSNDIGKVDYSNVLFGLTLQMPVGSSLPQKRLAKALVESLGTASLPVRPGPPLAKNEDIWLNVGVKPRS